MKTNRLLTTMLLMAATFCASEAMAQTPQYKDKIHGIYENPTGEPIIYHTTGKKLTLYAHPDPVYSPSYNNTNNTNINPQSQWRWVTGASWTGDELKDWTNENFVELTVAGSTTVYVKERFGTAGCEPADAQTKQIVAVGVPSIADGGITSNAVAAGFTHNSGDEYQICANPTNNVVFTLNITETNAEANMNKYGINLSVQSETMDNSAAWGNLQDEGTLSKSNEVTGGLSNFFTGNTITIDAANLAMKKSSGKDQPTRYTFTFAANSLRTQTSVLSDYRENPAISATAYTAYTSPSATFTFIIAPAPTTGPIYHIPNSFTGF